MQLPSEVEKEKNPGRTIYCLETHCEECRPGSSCLWGGGRVRSFRTWPLSVVFSPFAFSLERMGSFASYYGTRSEPSMNGMLLSASHYLENVGWLAGDEELSSDLSVRFLLLYCSPSLLSGSRSVCLWDLLLDACASDWTVCHYTILGKPKLTYLK